MSSLEIEDHHLPMMLALLSTERMAALKAITGSDRDAVDLHGQMLKVAAALMQVTALVEICLRNAVVEQLRAIFGTADWLQNPPSPFIWRGEEKNAIRRAQKHAQRAAYAKLNQHQKKRLDGLAFPKGIPANTSHEMRARKRQHAIQITQGQLIAQLTLAFWKRLFSSDYQSSLWDRSLKTIFPYKIIKRPMVAENLEIIYQFRNRIAHHEPVYGTRLASVLSSIDYIAENFGEKLNGKYTILQVLIQPYRDGLITESRLLSELLASYNVSSVE